MPRCDYIIDLGGCETPRINEDFWLKGARRLHFSTYLFFSFFFSFTPTHSLISQQLPENARRDYLSFFIPSFSMTHYATLRVTDLKDLLSKRKLPTNGNKAELVARLEAADRETAPLAPASAADAVAHLPSAEEYEVNWDEDDTAATGPKSAKLAPSKPESADVKKALSTPARAAGTKGSGAKVVDKTASTEPEGKKPFTFKRLADQFTDLTSAKTTEIKKTPSMPDIPKTTAATPSENPASLQKTEAEVKPATQEQSFSAGLAPTPLQVELEKRKARAARFGAEQVDPTAAESLKKLERAARFGSTNTHGDAGDAIVGVKGLDQALPERKVKRGGDHVNGGVRGGVQKRARYGDRGQRRQGGTGGIGGGDRRNSAPRKGTASVSILDDPAEREKAEKRRGRFGAVP